MWPPSSCEAWCCKPCVPAVSGPSGWGRRGATFSSTKNVKKLMRRKKRERRRTCLQLSESGVVERATLNPKKQRWPAICAGTDVEGRCSVLHCFLGVGLGGGRWIQSIHWRCARTCLQGKRCWSFIPRERGAGLQCTEIPHLLPPAPLHAGPKDLHTGDRFSARSVRRPARLQCCFWGLKTTTGPAFVWFLEEPFWWNQFFFVLQPVVFVMWKEEESISVVRLMCHGALVAWPYCWAAGQ